MSECDKMMSCLGFNETTVKNYGNAIPFASKKLDIMNRINHAGIETVGNSDLFALFYILSIAFLVMVMRFVVVIPTDDATLFTVFASILIRYSGQLLNSLNTLSLLISVVICVGTGVVIYQLKNEKHYC